MNISGQMYQFFKVNLAGQGYTEVWREKPPSLDLGIEVVDNSLPKPNTKALPPQITYAVSRLGRNQLLLAIGGYWAQHTDEFGRPGLFFWHGILCMLSEFDDQQVLALSNLLIGLVKQYETEYESLGKVIANLATKKQEGNWMDFFARMILGIPQSIDENTERMTSGFITNLNQVPTRTNLKVDPLLQKQFAIPFLLTLMSNRNDVARVSGGALAQVGIEQFQHISVSANIPGYQTVEVSRILSYQPKFEDKSEIAESRADKTYSERARQQARLALPYIVAILICSALALLLTIGAFQLGLPSKVGPFAVATSTAIVSTPTISTITPATLLVPNTSTATIAPTPTLGVTVSVPPPSPSLILVTQTPMATTTATQLPPTPAILGTHIVRFGETLFCIAGAYKVLPEAIAEQNGFSITTAPRKMVAGRALVIPNKPWAGIPAWVRPCPRQF